MTVEEFFLPLPSVMVACKVENNHNIMHKPVQRGKSKSMKRITHFFVVAAAKYLVVVNECYVLNLSSMKVLSSVFSNLSIILGFHWNVTTSGGHEYCR